MMLVIGVALQTVCASVPAADVNTNVDAGVKPIVPVSATGVHPPVVVTVYVPAAVGEPDIVTVVPATALVNPAGSPVTVAPVADPPKVYVMLVIGVALHTVCASVPAADDNTNVDAGVIAIVPVSVPWAHPPVVVTVYVPAAVGDPVM